MKKEDYPENDPCHHVAKIHGLLEDVSRHCRKDVAEIGEPKAQAPFETTAEVPSGLQAAFEDYARGREREMATD